MQWRKISVFYHRDIDEVCELSYFGRMEATLPHPIVSKLQAGNRTLLEMLDHDVNVGAQILCGDIVKFSCIDPPIMGAMVVADSVPCAFENFEWQVCRNLNPTLGDMIMDSDDRTKILLATYWIRPEGRFCRDPKHTNRGETSKKSRLH